MPVMIYKQRRETYDYDEPADIKRFLFTTTESIAAAIEELAKEMLHNETPEDWNNMGDEWKVEPRYAEACMTVEVIDKLEPLMRAYHNLQHSFFSMPSKGWYATDFGGREQKSAHEFHEPTLARFNKNLEQIKTTQVKQGVRFEWYDYSRKKQHIVHIITNMSGDFFTHDKFDAVDKTPYQLLVEEEEAEMERWLKHSKTDEYKQEQAERAQEQRDLATYMGENGMTSYANNGDGTYTTWR